MKHYTKSYIKFSDMSQISKEEKTGIKGLRIEKVGSEKNTKRISPQMMETSSISRL
jgi:hypothetical protein